MPSRAEHPGSREFTAPARVNLIGEHTDYTGGLVLPMAISFYTHATIAPAQHSESTLRTDLFPERRMVAADETPERANDWSDYPVGVLTKLREYGIHPPPFDLRLGGNIPLGSGLSSSASVEVVSALAMLSLTGHTLPGKELALLCQRAENEFVQSPCGIMDQFVIANARTGHALLLNTRTLEFELIPMNAGPLAECRIVVLNSMVKHSVASGEYGVRRRELEAGQKILRETFPHLRDLGDATLEHLLQVQANISPESFLRCRHIITENHRVRQAREAMIAGDPVRLGKLITLAHISERDDFACSCDEIDFLVDAAIVQPGCFGARLTGGGFGGCTINLVHRDACDDFISTLQTAYQEHFRIEAEAYVCDAVDGAIHMNEASLSREV